MNRIGLEGTQRVASVGGGEDDGEAPLVAHGIEHLEAVEAHLAQARKLQAKVGGASSL